jgi:hypothetical protein
MRTVRLIWRPRISKKKRAVILKWIRQHYRKVTDYGDYVQLRAPNDCTKFIWIFMFSKTFSDLE